MDDDILSQGDDREPSRWPRHLGMIVAVVAVAVGGVGGIVYLARPHGRPAASAAQPTPLITPSPVPTSRPGPVASPEFTRLPVTPNGIIGKSTPWEDGLRLPISGTQPAWFWPATGRSETIGGLPANDYGYQFTRVGGGWAVQADRTSCGGGDCVTPPSPVWFLGNGAQSATPVGTADSVAPAAGTDALWLTSYFRTASNATATGLAREVSPSGTQLAPSVILPRGAVIDQATDLGLLLVSPSGQTGEWAYTLWDPASRKPILAFNDVIAASATDIAWTSGCAATCRVQVLDLVTGRKTAVELPAGGSAADGSFSPSGRLLALQLSYGPDGGLVRELDVASVATGRLTEVTRTYVTNDTLVDFGWPTEGDNLVAEFAFMPTIQLASWHLGASRLAASVLSAGRAQGSLVVG
jgi:hypothetical protein